MNGIRGMNGIGRDEVKGGEERRDKERRGEKRRGSSV